MFRGGGACCSEQAVTSLPPPLTASLNICSRRKPVDSATLRKLLLLTRYCDIKGLPGKSTLVKYHCTHIRGEKISKTPSTVFTVKTKLGTQTN